MPPANTAKTKTPKAAAAKTKATKTKTTQAKSRYGIHPGVLMMQDWVATLADKTGKSLDQWLAFIKKDGPKDEKAARAWLKDKHKLGTNSAWWLAERAFATPDALRDEDPDQYLQMAEQYVEDQYAGAKAGLRPIYDKLLDLGLAIAKDIKACPCKTIVPLYREHVIAQIKPTTRTRIDFGLALAKHKGKLPARLIDTGGLAKKDRITHRIEIESVGEVDQDVGKWLQVAYDLDV